MFSAGLSKFILTVIFISFFPHGSRGEVFTATADMETLVNMEKELLTMLRVYVDFVEVRVREMLQFVNPLNCCKTGNQECKQCGRDFSNPVGAIKLLNRFLTKWPDVGQKLQEIATVGVEFKSYFNKKRELPEMPGEVDLNGAAAAIFRLQSVYQLDAKSILKGNIYLASKNMLNLEDIIELGRIAYYKKKMKRAKEWLDVAMELLAVNSEKMDDAKIKELVLEVREYLALVEYELGHMSIAWNHTAEILKIEPEHERALENIDTITSEMEKKSNEHKREEDSKSLRYSYDLYESLCRRDRSIPQAFPWASAKETMCGYKKDSPALLIKPVAYEVLSVDPEIMVFHNVIGDKDIETIRKLAYPKLVRATVNNIQTGKSQVADYRISKSGWLSDSDHEVIEKVSRRLEVVTGLKSKTAEELQVANYGIGGHYDPHFDWARNFPISDLKLYGQGNRIATALLYMTDVEAGGGTAFLSPKVTVWPKKGSVAFWYNLYRNGTGKYSTQHAACPVLLGSKWVANKWFHEYGQEFTRPCTLNRWE